MGKKRDNRGGYPKYQVGTWKGKHVVRKFIGFDHMWAEYSKPLASFDTEAEAQAFVKSKEITK